MTEMRARLQIRREGRAMCGRQDSTEYVRFSRFNDKLYTLTHYRDRESIYRYTDRDLFATLEMLKEKEGRMTMLYLEVLPSDYSVNFEPERDFVLYRILLYSRDDKFTINKKVISNVVDEIYYL